MSTPVKSFYNSGIVTDLIRRRAPTTGRGRRKQRKPKATSGGTSRRPRRGTRTPCPRPVSRLRVPSPFGTAGLGFLCFVRGKARNTKARRMVVFLNLLISPLVKRKQQFTFSVFPLFIGPYYHLRVIISRRCLHDIPTLREPVPAPGPAAPGAAPTAIAATTVFAAPVESGAAVEPVAVAPPAASVTMLPPTPPATDSDRPEVPAVAHLFLR